MNSEDGMWFILPERFKPKVSTEVVFDEATGNYHLRATMTSPLFDKPIVQVYVAQLKVEDDEPV